MKNHIYILGTGLSHDGSACLLKDGKICVAIEKERVTRFKHDGGNDTAAINYCLQAEGITLKDLDLVVQNANFGLFKFGNEQFRGDRLFLKEAPGIPVVTISHHLAHAYSTVGTCPYDQFNVLVMDGCGNSFDDCTDLQGAYIFDNPMVEQLPHLFNEKDSYYTFENNHLSTVVKDFSEWGMENKEYLMHPLSTKHSIGGVYAAASLYCFGNMNDSGKLMGLGPYGRPGVFQDEIFEMRDGRIFVNYNWMEKFRRPARSADDFKNNFQYYSDIAYWIQRQVEKAIHYIFKSRLEFAPAENLCYAGGTALNAVANAKLLSSGTVKNLYIEPAAGDNGLALGCAFYGWIEVLKKERVRHNGSTCFGINYSKGETTAAIDSYLRPKCVVKINKTVDRFFELLNKERILNQGPSATIQFNVEDFGVYQVKITEGIKSRKEVFSNPTSTVRVNGTRLYKSLLQDKCWCSMATSTGMLISDSREIDMLQKSVDFGNLLKTIKQEIKIDDDEKVSYSQSDTSIKRTAALLAEGKVIAWYQQGCEFGPRALGRRSIIADPRSENIRDFINLKIKLREDFRPFAPSVLKEDVTVYFKNGFESPYMILVDSVRDEWRNKIKSVVHQDDTSRVQTVTRDWNPRYYELLQEFKKLTGISLLLNTSLNRKGMPIVETPAEALDFFFSSEIDYLVMNDCVISK